MLLGILLSAFVGTVVLGAQTSEGTVDLLSVNRLFANVAGRWSCAGAFADGRPLSSDITITLRVDGRAVQYQHHDRAPNDFTQEALWGPDTQNNQIVSVAFAGNATALGPQLLVAKVWSERSVVFEARSLTSPPFAPNRFTYTIEPPNTLKMVWEVERNGAWSVGDRISCNRTS
jgi:hypothetical protein